MHLYPALRVWPTGLVERLSHLRIGCHTVLKSTINKKGNANPMGIYELHETLRAKAFGQGKGNNPDRELMLMSLKHLRDHDLLGKPTNEPENLPPLDMPSLVGSNLDEHFQKIARVMSDPYLKWCNAFVSGPFDKKIPKLISRDQFKMQSGWIKYSLDNHNTLNIEKVQHPTDQVIVFDCETLYNIHKFAVMATAVSPDAWYVWISPWLLGETEDQCQLISLGHHKQVVIGHNVSYDRIRVKEEYSLKQSEKFFLDTMSLHVATQGMCSRQRPEWQRNKKLKKAVEAESDIDVELGAHDFLDEATQAAQASEDPWMGQACLNSLKAVVEFFYGVNLDKSRRDLLSSISREEAVNLLPELLEYCASDVYYTKLVFDKVHPAFQKLCPHPVSFAALKEIGSLILPVDQNWNHYRETCEKKYQEMTTRVIDRLRSMAEDLSLYTESGNEEKLKQALQDPWLSQLDWTVKPLRFVEDKKTKTKRLSKRQKQPGKPQWYKDLFKSSKEPMHITTRSRVTPILLRMSWDGQPLYWVDSAGWCFLAPKAQKSHYEELNFRIVDQVPSSFKGKVLFKLPHSNGDEARCANPLAKGYFNYFQRGILSSANADALEAIESSVQCSYWISVRERVASQLALYQSNMDMGLPGKDTGIILPQIVPMGTVTRRAVEPTWLTASNAKKNKLGSELKSTVRAPPGFVFVGADVDSEELWIASVIGDALFGYHGGTALGWMTLEGSKSQGTDLHSRTAGILGISRNEAKVFNYGRIYGAGIKFAIQLLKQFNPKISDEEAKDAATKLYRATKGVRNVSGSKENRMWRAGSESIVFNQMERMAMQDNDIQRTVVLGAGITSALQKSLLGKNSYLTSRVNWSIQSSGVDYLHLLIVSMYYLLNVYKIDARLCLTVHDEVRYLCKEEDQFRCSLALQIANFWTRAMFCQQLGFKNMPQSIAFFSLIDLDKVLRKEVDLDCVTPSNPDPIPPGESLDISGVLEKCNSLGTPNDSFIAQIQRQKYVPREPVLRKVNASNTNEHIRLQLTQDEGEARKIARYIRSKSYRSTKRDSYPSHDLFHAGYDMKAKAKQKRPQQRRPITLKSQIPT